MGTVSIKAMKSCLIQYMQCTCRWQDSKNATYKLASSSIKHSSACFSIKPCIIVTFNSNYKPHPHSFVDKLLDTIQIKAFGFQYLNLPIQSSYLCPAATWTIMPCMHACTAKKLMVISTMVWLLELHLAMSSDLQYCDHNGTMFS